MSSDLPHCQVNVPARHSLDRVTAEALRHHAFGLPAR